jgi:hypothetical protein
LLGWPRVLGRHASVHFLKKVNPLAVIGVLTLPWVDSGSLILLVAAFSAVLSSSGLWRRRLVSVIWLLLALKELLRFDQTFFALLIYHRG